MSNLELLFVIWAFTFQSVLIIHFALRKWAFEVVQRYGWIVYALSIPAAIISVALLVGGLSWSFWLGGFLYLIWAAYGYRTEYIEKNTTWRSPLYWPVAGPYVTLYLATIMFYWWPLGLIERWMWYLYAILFVVSTILNVTSHKPARKLST